MQVIYKSSLGFAFHLVPCVSSVCVQVMVFGLGYMINRTFSGHPSSRTQPCKCSQLSRVPGTWARLLRPLWLSSVFHGAFCYLSGLSDHMLFAPTSGPLWRWPFPFVWHRDCHHFWWCPGHAFFCILLLIRSAHSAGEAAGFPGPCCSGRTTRLGLEVREDKQVAGGIHPRLKSHRVPTFFPKVQ